MANTFPLLSQYSEYLLSRYENFPHRRYASLIILRKTETETIFRTEGSGEGLVKETVLAGRKNETAIRRVVISKRKQTAVERRTGRELLREHDLLKMVEKEKLELIPCSLNMTAPCGKCIDCMLYGYAVGGGGAQKSRVMTDDAYSLAPAPQVTGRHTFNATFDTGTMRNPLTDEPSTSLGNDEFVRPESHFLDIETLKDVTAGELRYVLANILRSSRYGAITSRMGKMKNEVLALVFSDTELFSNLELTQEVYDLLYDQEKGKLDFPLLGSAVHTATEQAINTLLKSLVSRTPRVIRGDELQSIIDETIRLFREKDDVRTFLREIEQGYER